ncbi:hypothetical protein DRN69_00210 [Candidatus Pacearchaeota archaeon]|nr:MAG: hypothetical protein DRN69_00210 [Candidatus Pacearchaeota archaeon]
MFSRNKIEKVIKRAEDLGLNLEVIRRIIEEIKNDQYCYLAKLVKKIGLSRLSLAKYISFLKGADIIEEVETGRIKMLRLKNRK